MVSIAIIIHIYHYLIYNTCIRATVAENSQNQHDLISDWFSRISLNDNWDSTLNIAHRGGTFGELNCCAGQVGGRASNQFDGPGAAYRTIRPPRACRVVVRPNLTLEVEPRAHSTTQFRLEETTSAILSDAVLEYNRVVRV